MAQSSHVMMLALTSNCWGIMLLCPMSLSLQDDQRESSGNELVVKKPVQRSKTDEVGSVGVREEGGGGGGW